MMLALALAALRATTRTSDDLVEFRTLRLKIVSDGSSPSGMLRGDPDALTSKLMELGAVSTTQEDLGTPRGEAAVGGGDAGGGAWAREASWSRSTVSAMFSRTVEVQSVIDGLREAGFGAIAAEDCGVEAVAADDDWVAKVEAARPPVVVGEGIRVVFPWHSRAPPLAGRRDLRLEGGAGFGSGEHPTTQMCVEFLERSARGRRVVDYGCGSGILALVACLCGAREARGVDVDAVALEAAASNARANPDLAPAPTFHLAPGAAAPSSARFPPLDAGDRCDVLVANILAEILPALAPTLAGLVEDGGAVALSGVRAAEAPGVLAAFDAAFDLRAADVRDGWCVLAGTRK